MSNNQNFDCLQKSEWNFSTINEYDQMNELTSTYTIKMESNMNEEIETEDFLYENKQCKISIGLFIVQIKKFFFFFSYFFRRYL